jgi:hypothetical protein
MVGVLSLMVLCLLDSLHLVINTNLGEVAILSLRGVIDHVFLFVVLVLHGETGVVFPWWTRFDRMDRNFDRRGRMDVAKTMFEEMARQWFETFGTNPSVESFALSHSWF